MDRLFLDANILFSAAYRSDAGLAGFWALHEVVLLGSVYAFEEARLNLADTEQRARLVKLVNALELIPLFKGSLPAGIELPLKDQPILLSAIQGRATHLITGDKDHFGAYFGRTVSGVLVIPPAWYLKSRRR